MKKCKIEGCENKVHAKLMCKKCYDKQYTSGHKEKIKANKKRYRLDNREKLLKIDKQYRLDNKDELNKKSRQYNSDNKDELKEYKKQYDLTHREERNKRARQKRQSDPVSRIMDNASRSINKMLKRNGSSKQGKRSKDHFSFTEATIRAYIESLFSHPDNLDEDGNIWMTWDNQGNYDPNRKTWHLDHIIPQSKLQFNSYEHPNFDKCWALENLRPLEAIKNLKKGSKY
jgi:hypothetical protein